MKTKNTNRRTVFLSAAGHILALFAVTASAQHPGRSSSVLDDIIVTATRIETNLQQTPMSVYAPSGEIGAPSMYSSTR
jgi:hypothetical protein